MADGKEHRLKRRYEKGKYAWPGTDWLWELNPPEFLKRLLRERPRQEYILRRVHDNCKNFAISFHQRTNLKPLAFWKKKQSRELETSKS